MHKVKPYKCSGRTFDLGHFVGLFGGAGACKTVWANLTSPAIDAIVALSANDRKGAWLNGNVGNGSDGRVACQS